MRAHAPRAKGAFTGAHASHMVFDDPATTAAAAMAAQEQRHSAAQQQSDAAVHVDAALRAHHALISPEGNLHPVILSGYISDPGLPLAAINEHSAGFGAPVVALPRETAVPLDPVSAAVDLYASDIVLPDYNLYGSILAVDLGCLPAPRYGHVYVMMRPGPDGIIRKLSLPIKDTLERKLRVFAHVLSGDLADFHQRAEAYARVTQLLAHLDRVHQAARGQQSLW